MSPRIYSSSADAVVRVEDDVWTRGRGPVKRPRRGNSSSVCAGARAMEHVFQPDSTGVNNVLCVCVYG
jgi:hypothetical protein